MTKKYLLWAVLGALVVGGYYLLSQPVTPGTDEVTGVPTTDKPSTGSTASKPAGSVPAKDLGRLVFSITDEAVKLDNAQSVLVNITRVEAFNAQKGWVTISSTPQTFDLVQLKKDGRFVLLGDKQVSFGDYTQVRLVIGTVVVLKDGVAHDARILNKDLRLVTNFAVARGATSAVTVDILGDKSLHRTSSGKYIFASVLNLKTYERVEQVQIANKKVELIGGTIKYNSTIGVDENGDLKIGYEINSAATLEILGDAIIVTSAGYDTNFFKFSAAESIKIAIDAGHIAVALSAKSINNDEYSPVWQIIGVKNGKRVLVKVHGTSGKIIYVQ
ncbi:MAG: hypothetical protein G01um10143_579 [Parcubacteria group bacterium Gr01-1014_3]|nr:MAG: hypothetical protein G01um10143_579 [Parcubacteria group bacterium Gr01-1014_3]